MPDRSDGPGGNAEAPGRLYSQACANALTERLPPGSTMQYVRKFVMPHILDFEALLNASPYPYLVVAVD
jgi:hypothetical protein